MPATAGRVRMPHNNRMSTSASLKTTGIWATTIGHDPYAGQADDGEEREQQVEHTETEKQLLEAAKKLNVADGIMRDDFARKMYQGLKGGKKRRGMGDEVAEAKARERQELLKVLDEEESSSDDDEEAIETLQRRAKEKKEKAKKKKKDKKKHKKKRSKKKYSSSDDDSSDDSDDDNNSSQSSESSFERRKRKKKKKSKHHKKERKRSKAYSSSSDDESDDDSRRRSKGKKKRRRCHESSESGDGEKKKSASNSESSKKTQSEREPFLSSDTFAGSKKGYVFREGEKGLGYYLDDAPIVDPKRLSQQLQRFTD